MTKRLKLYWKDISPDMRRYDSVIIGAGIAGAMIAYKLREKGQKVLVLDKRGIASGASGAAGAFVSPKIGKGSPLQKLTNKAFAYAKEFYLSTCTEYFHQTGIIRIPKDEYDAQKFKEYEKYNENKYEWYTKERLQSLGIDAGFDSFYFPEAGDCDASDICKFLLKEIEVRIEEVLHIQKENHLYRLFSPTSKILTKNIVLATGYESMLADLRYMGIRGTWGTRGDFYSTLKLPISMHQSVSIGAKRKGIMKLGATHEKEVSKPMPCKIKQAEVLKFKASSLIDSSDLVLDKLYCGMRAGSKDYFPLVGKVVDVAYILENHPSVMRGKRVDFRYIEGLYVLNGLGGRGFVFAPLMAKILAEHIVEKKALDRRVTPDRLFLKWCRKLNNQ